MARISEHHVAKCGVEGKCSVPMWSNCLPSGFCDRPAWGQQYSYGSQYAPQHWSPKDRNGFYLFPHLIPPYSPNLCCDHHGGPGPDDIRFVMDGNMWCAFLPDFINLQESVAGFGETQAEAESDLRNALVSLGRV